MKKDELRQYDGKDGHPAYILCKGRIYDVSASSRWKGGTHMARHNAGEDLTDFIALAPHGEEVFTRVTEVGSIQEDKPASPDMKDKLRELYRKVHPHPVTVHFPIALSNFAALMQFLFIVVNDSSFENAAFYALVCTALSAFPAAGSGMFSWWLNYESTMTSIFKNKLVFSGLLVIMSISAVTLRLFIPDISIQPGMASMLYNAIIFTQVPVAMFVAYNGGKVVWPS